MAHFDEPDQNAMAKNFNDWTKTRDNMLRSLQDTQDILARRKAAAVKPISQEAQFEANLNEFDRMMLKGMCISL